jgi:hypothetical protein
MLARLFLVFAAAVCMGCTGAASSEPTRVNENGFVLVEGKPRLVLGVYDLPSGRRGHEDVLLKEVADSGFDLMRGQANKAALDRLHAHGLHGWIRLRGLALPEGDADARQQLADTVNEFKDHPGLFCWEGPDESLWKVYWDKYQWYCKEQPAKLKELIAKVAAEGNPQAAKYGRILEKALDYTSRSLAKESDELYATLWRELGVENPHPRQTFTAAVAEVAPRAAAYARGWAVVAELDPAHPRWQNHAPCNSTRERRLFSEGATAAGCDVYPAPNYSGVRGADLLPTLEPTSVGAATDLMRASAPGEACWMVLQGFGWHDLATTNENPEGKEPTDPVRGRRPNRQELRFMTYDALLHGATGILYWGTSRIEKDSALWKDIMRMGRELRALEPALVAPDAGKPIVEAETNWSTFDGGDPKVRLRQVGDDWVLIAVNEWRTGVAFTVRDLPAALEGKTLRRLYSDEEHVVKGGQFRDGILGHDVHVYATSRRFE